MTCFISIFDNIKPEIIMKKPVYLVLIMFVILYSVLCLSSCDDRIPAKMCPLRNYNFCQEKFYSRHISVKLYKLKNEYYRLEFSDNDCVTINTSTKNELCREWGHKYLQLCN